MADAASGNHSPGGENTRSSAAEWPDWSARLLAAFPEFLERAEAEFGHFKESSDYLVYELIFARYLEGLIDAPSTSEGKVLLEQAFAFVESVAEAQITLEPGWSKRTQRYLTTYPQELIRVGVLEHLRTSEGGARRVRAAIPFMGPVTRRIFEADPMNKRFVPS